MHINLKSLLQFEFPLLLAIAVFLTPNDSFAAKKNAVQQLVEWELTANSSISSHDLQRIASYILHNPDKAEIPIPLLNSILNEMQMNSQEEFRKMPGKQKAKALEMISLSNLKKIVLLPVKIEYYELSIDELNRFSYLTTHELPDFKDNKARDAIYFTKESKKYVRWFQHPLTIKSEIHPEIAKKVGDFKAHFTSSRSLIVFKDSYEDAFSIKLSLRNAIGIFKEKKIRSKELKAWFKHNLYLNEVMRHFEFPTFKFLQEPVGFGLQQETSMDLKEDGFIARSIEPLAKGDVYYLPAFSMLDTEVGAQIALKNGSRNPLSFWKMHFLIPFANAMAELRAYTGAEHSCPHSQNVLIELDQNYKPTGKIILRDSDFYIEKPYFETLNKVIPPNQVEGMLQQKWLIDGELFKIQHGLKNLPSWMSQSEYGDWVRNYFDSYAKRYTELTGISVQSNEIFKISTHSNAPVLVIGNNFAQGSDDNIHQIKMRSSEKSLNKWLNELSQKMEGTRVIIDPLPKVKNFKDISSAEQVKIGDEFEDSEGQKFKIISKKSDLAWGILFEVKGADSNSYFLVVARESDRSINPAEEKNRYQQLEEAGIPFASMLEFNERNYLQDFREDGTSAKKFLETYDEKLAHHRHVLKKLGLLFEKLKKQSIPFSKIDYNSIIYNKMHSEWELVSVVTPYSDYFEQNSVAQQQKKLLELIPSLGASLENLKIKDITSSKEIKIGTLVEDARGQVYTVVSLKREMQWGILFEVVNNGKQYSLVVAKSADPDLNATDAKEKYIHLKEEGILILENYEFTSRAYLREFVPLLAAPKFIEVEEVKKKYPEMLKELEGFLKDSVHKGIDVFHMDLGNIIYNARLGKWLLATSIAIPKNKSEILQHQQWKKLFKLFPHLSSDIQCEPRLTRSHHFQNAD